MQADSLPSEPPGKRPALAGGFFTLAPPGKPILAVLWKINWKKWEQETHLVTSKGRNGRAVRVVTEQLEESSLDLRISRHGTECAHELAVLATWMLPVATARQWEGMKLDI